MLRSIVAGSLRLRFVVIVLALLLAGQGLWTALYRTPLDVFPEFAPPFLIVQTEAPGLSSEEVENLVSLPLESALNGSSRLQRLHSISQPGISVLKLFFEEGVDVLQARQLVSERLSAEASRLPAGVHPPRIQPVTSSTSRLLMIALTSSTLSSTDLRTFATWTFRPRLLGVPGVAAVTVFGGDEKEYQVLVDPERLRQVDLTLGDILRAARDSVAKGGAGLLDSPTQRVPARQMSPVHGPADIAATLVALRQGYPLFLGQVTDVQIGAPLKVGEAVIGDDKGARTGVLIIVEKQPWFNTLEVTRDLERAIASLRPAFPPGLELDTGIFRQATFIDHALANLKTAIIIGCVLVAVILLVFLLEWRTAVISLSAIPLSLLGAVVVLRWLGMEFNTLVLGGLAISIGEVVDDAIIDVENILRRLRLNRRADAPRSALSVILDASLEVRSSVVFASFVVSLVFLPIFFLQGVEGAFFRPLALAYILAILASLAVALIVTPALCLVLLGGGDRTRSDPARFTLWLRSVYRSFLSRALRRPGFLAVCILVVLALAGALSMPLWRKGEFLPKFRERNLLVHWLARPGTSISEMERIGLELCRQVMAVPGVKTFGQLIGRAEGSEDIGDTNFSEITITIDDDVKDLDAIGDSVERIASSFPGITHSIFTFLGERIEEVLGEGSPAPIIVRIYGPDLKVLREKAEEVRQAMSKVQGAANAQVEAIDDVPQLEIKHRRQDLARYGLTPGALHEAINVLLSGATVAQVYEEEKVFDLVVWGSPGARGDIDALGRALIDTPSGARVPLSALADLSVVPAPHKVVRENASRRIGVGCFVSGRGVSEVAADVARQVALIQFPAGYHPEVLGEHEALAAARQRMIALGFAALVGIFMLLYTDFKSLRETSLILLSLPFALIGGVFSAALGGLGIGLGSMVGFVTVFGIAARNGILLVSHYQHLKDNEGVPLGDELFLRGAEERLTPILMTSLATGLALLPFALGGARPGYEIEHPMAVVILGGLVSSTALNLVVVPVVYRLVARPGG